MKVSELIEKLKDYNSKATISIVVHNYPYKFSIGWGGGKEGDTKEDCKEVNFYVDELCQSDKEKK